MRFELLASEALMLISCLVLYGSSIRLVRQIVFVGLQQGKPFLNHYTSNLDQRSIFGRKFNIDHASTINR
jgi:hypothetical protein